MIDPNAGLLFMQASQNPAAATAPVGPVANVGAVDMFSPNVAQDAGLFARDMQAAPSQGFDARQLLTALGGVPQQGQEQPTQFMRPAPLGLLGMPQQLQTVNTLSPMAQLGLLLGGGPYA